jgi:phage terminase large subunit-like protein
LSTAADPLATKLTKDPRALEALSDELARMGPVVNFPWHGQQEHALRAATDVVAVIGGNRSGKTQVAVGIVSRLVRREGPIYQRLRNPEGRPITIWVAPQTFEKYHSLWEERLTHMAFEGITFEYVRSPFPVFKWKDAHGGGVLAGKAQKQGFLAFESNEVDLIVFDEEPDDPQIITSAKTRFATTNGVMVLAYTPLKGMSFTYHQLYAPTVKPELEVADRVYRNGNSVTVVKMGMADNPEAVAGGGVARIVADPSMTEAEKAARLYGEYGYTEGLLIPQWAMVGLTQGDPYVIERLPAGRAYSWVLTADPNKRHGALLTAIDHEGNRFYCAEHYAESIPDSHHAAEYMRMLAQFGVTLDECQVWCDPGGAGAQAMLNLAEAGIFARGVPKDPGSVSASIKRLRGAAFIDPTHRHPVTGRLGAPRVYFLRSLASTWSVRNVEYRESRLMWEFRQYRQKEEAAPDTPVKEFDDLVDCARYVELVRAISPDAPMQDWKSQLRAGLDDASRREQDEFDKLAAQHERMYANMKAQAAARFIAERQNPNNKLH